MELGNALFGNSRGRFSVPREDDWMRPLERLFDACAPERDTSWRDYGTEYENDVFAVFPYYWGDCTCGYEERWQEKDSAWCGEHGHRPTCYQTEYRTWMRAYDTQSGYAAIDAAAFPGGPSIFGGFDTTTEHPEPGVTTFVMEPRRDSAMEAWSAAHDQRRRFEDHVFAALCKKHKRSRLGAAIHCTCDYDRLRSEWVATDDHDPRCPLVRPNFHFKPTDFRLDWYKYPLRDSYMNQRLTASEFSAIIDQCVASVGQTA